MSKKKTKLQIAQEQAEKVLSLTNKKIEELGVHTSGLYTALNSIQECFDQIRNVPSEKQLEYEKLKSIRLQWELPQPLALLLPVRLWLSILG